MDKKDHHVVALDGVRGLAILLVLSYHYFVVGSLQPTGVGRAIVAVAKMGWAGVDLFFVLSGFLITRILLEARSATNYYQIFYARRVLRIFPVYYLAVVLVFWVLMPLQHHGGFFALHPVAMVGYREQLWYWANLSNLRTAFYPLLIPALSPFWSLAIEEQFYAVWPAIVRNLQTRWLLGLCVAGSATSVALRSLPWIRHWSLIYPDLIYRMTPMHADGLLWGAVAAILLPIYGQRRAVRNLVVAVLWVSFALIAILASRPAGAVMAAIGFSVIAVFAASLVWLCAAPVGSKAVRFVLSRKVLVQLGKYSYFIYVFHALTFIYVPIVGRHFLHGSTIETHHPYYVHILLACLSFVFTYAGAVLSSRFFEGPILRYKRHLPYHFAPQVTYKPASEERELSMRAAGTWGVR